MSTLSSAKPDVEEGHSLLRLAGDIFFVIAAVLVLGAALLYAGLRLYGVQFYEVSTPSMTPTFGKGAVVAAKQVAPQELKIGDVVVFLKDGFRSPYVHRITRIQSDPDLRAIVKNQEGKVLKDTMTWSERTIWTKGDANPVEDVSPTMGGSVLGRELFVVPPPFNLLVTKLNKSTLMALGVGSILVFILWEMLDGARDLLRRRARKSEA